MIAMRSSSLFRLACAFVWLIALPGAADAAAPEAGTTAARRPNFLVILADDLGYGDLGCYGNSVTKTPNIDRLAAEGLRLTDCYAASAVCSPARAGLMTGRTPWRVGIHNWIPMFCPMHVGKHEITIATLLRQAGYNTCQVGKWHMNGLFNQPGQPQPPDHGFDYWFATQNNALPNHHNPDNFIRNAKPVGRIEGYSSQIVVDEAIHWLKDVCDKDRPFFLYVCFHEPHDPIATDRKYRDLYPSDDPTYSDYHGNVTQMDDNLGRLMRFVDGQGLRDDTFVFFTSDNGPALDICRHASAGPLRETKGSLYEGGIRVPGIVRWPGHTRPGTVSTEPVCGVDLLPTLCAVTGIAAPADRAIDGASFLPILDGKPSDRKTPLYWQYIRASSKPKVTMRVGDWKILAQLDTPELKPGVDQTPEEMSRFKTAELTTFELYNLRRDVGETTNLAKQEPERVAEMSARLRRLYHEIREESPVWPAWKWTNYEGERLKRPDYWWNRKRAAADQWQSLFNGKDLTGWQGVDGPPDNWKVADGVLSCTGGPGSRWIATQETFGDFELELEFKISPGGNSGVFLRMPLKAKALSATDGMEIQIADDYAPQYVELGVMKHTGALYAIEPPAKQVSKKAGQWQQMRIVCAGRRLHVFLNGQQVLDADLDAYPEEAKGRPGLKRKNGHIGLQNHQSPVEFRNIRIRPGMPTR